MPHRGLAVGALLAGVAREPGGLARYRRPARLTIYALLPLIIGIPVAEELFLPPNAFGLGFGPVFNTVGVSLLAVFFGALVILVATAEPGSRLHRIFGSAFLRTFGKYSYGLYLIHLPLRAVIRDRIYGPSNRLAWISYPRLFGSELPGQMIFYLVAGGAALGVAWISFHLFENQFIKLKRFFPSGARRGPSAPQPGED